MDVNWHRDNSSFRVLIMCTLSHSRQILANPPAFGLRFAVQIPPISHSDLCHLIILDAKFISKLETIRHRRYSAKQTAKNPIELHHNKKTIALTHRFASNWQRRRTEWETWSKKRKRVADRERHSAALVVVVNSCTVSRANNTLAMRVVFFIADEFINKSSLIRSLSRCAWHCCRSVDKCLAITKESNATKIT